MSSYRLPRLTRKRGYAASNDRGRAEVKYQWKECVYRGKVSVKECSISDHYPERVKINQKSLWLEKTRIIYQWTIKRCTSIENLNLTSKKTRYLMVNPYAITNNRSRLQSTFYLAINNNLACISVVVILLTMC